MLLRFLQFAKPAFLKQGIDFASDTNQVNLLNQALGSSGLEDTEKIKSAELAGSHESDECEEYDCETDDECEESFEEGADCESGFALPLYGKALCTGMDGKFKNGCECYVDYHEDCRSGRCSDHWSNASGRPICDDKLGEGQSCEYNQDCISDTCTEDFVCAGGDGLLGARAVTATLSKK